MILLKKLQLNNFLSHESTLVEFSPNEKLLVDGASGAGKSSIFDAIIWALYGVGRSDNRSLIRKGSKKAVVDLWITRGQETFVITRTVAAGGKHTVDIFTEQPDGSLLNYPLAGVREVQNWIETKLIGASYLLFVNSIAYVQGNGDSFVSQTAPKRKELLLEIVQAEDYTKYYEKARQSLSFLESEHSMASGQLIELEGILASITGRIAEKQEFIDEITKNTALLAVLDPEIKKLEEERDALMVLSNSLETIINNIEMASMQKEAIYHDLKLKKEKAAKKPILDEELKKKPLVIQEISLMLTALEMNRKTMDDAKIEMAKRDDVARRKPVVIDRSSEVSRLNKEIQLIKSKPQCPAGAQCPYGGNDLSSLDAIMDKVQSLVLLDQAEQDSFSAWKQEYDALPLEPTHDLSKISEDTSKLESIMKEKGEEIHRLNLVEKELEYIDDINRELMILESSFLKKITELDNLKLEKDRVEKVANKEGFDRVTKLLMEKRAERNAYQSNLERAQFQLDSIVREEEAAVSVKKKISEIREGVIPIIVDKQKKLLLVKEAFGEKGIKTLVIDYLLTSLEEKINEVLSRLSDFRIRLDTQRKSADGETTVEGLFITVCNEMGEEMPFESYSGGEKVRIVFSISEALASLSSKKVGFRLIDEAVLALDDNSLESFMDVVNTLLGDFDQVMFISHIQGVKDLFDKRLVIKKKNGISSSHLVE